VELRAEANFPQHYRSRELVDGLTLRVGPLLHHPECLVDRAARLLANHPARLGDDRTRQLSVVHMLRFTLAQVCETSTRSERRYDGEGRPPVTDGPFAETKDLIAGWMVIDVDSYERAIELAGELSAAPGAGGEPIHEWLEVRPFLTAPPTVTQ
jgi:hypothetical protein